MSLRQLFENFAFFQQVSIRRLLKLMGISWVLATLIFATAVIVSNHFIIKKQEELIRVVLPVNEVKKHLSEIVADIISRKANIASAQSLEEFSLYLDNNKTKKSFSDQIESLESLIKHDDHHMVSDLYVAYEDYLYQDEIMSSLIRKNLNIDAQISAKMSEINVLVQQAKNSVEKVVGIIHLRTSRENRRLRKLLEDSDTVPDATLSVIAQLLNSPFSKERFVHRAGNEILHGADTLIHHFFQIRYETNRDVLINIRDNEVSQQIKRLQSAFKTLKSGTYASPDLLDETLILEKAITTLVHLLISAEDSIYNLKSESLSLKAVMQDERENLLTTVEDIQDGLGRLTLIASSLSNKAISRTREISQHVLLAIIIECFITLALSFSSVLLLMLRINNPLRELDKAMSDLSNGKLATRLETKGKPKDEFLDLAKAFNSFVEKNEHMIVSLSKARKQLADSESRTSAILENALVGIVHIKEGKFISVNKKFEEMFGYSREEIQGHDTSIIYAKNELYKSIGIEDDRRLLDAGHCEGEWQVKKKYGRFFLCNISAKLIDKEMPSKGFICIYEDISERKNNEDKLRYLANYDTLTKLPNRAYFQSQLEKDILAAKHNGTELAVMFIDLDRFKQVNDSLGHDAGDQLLQKVALRLKSCVRGSDSVSRIGGDEFTIIVTGLINYDAIEYVANKILCALKDPVELIDELVSVSPSIGVSIYPAHGTTVSSLVKNADAAMYHAKEMGRNNFQYYREEMNSKSLDHLAMENKLREALSRDEFVLYYQPQVNTLTREVIGYEALIRWQNEDLGLVSPADFIPLLEESGLIVSVGEWVLRTACHQLVQWQKNGREQIKMSVNLSAKQFKQKGLVSVVDTILKETTLDPAFLDLEITETILMDGTENSQDMLQELHQLGVRLSLDDFGTGYSSLAYLKRFPIDVIKIDQSFVRGCLGDKSDAAICEAIIDIAHRLQLDVVAEGVETEEQMAYMHANHCHTIQGFLFGRPMPAEEINQMKPSGKVHSVAI